MPKPTSSSSPVSLPLFFRSARQLLTLAGPPIPRRGRDLAELGIIEDGAVLTEGARIVRVGRTSELEAEAVRSGAEAIDCRGRVMMPGFVDCHTHLVFAGNRVGDYESRLRGRTSLEIAKTGGGIRLSAKLLREATQAELVTQAAGFLKQFAAHGTTTLEVKSGYGLDVENEIKTLKVVRRLAKISPVDLVPTLLAAHALPTEFSSNRQGYVKLIEKSLIPQVARKKLAEFVDCFCDEGAFTVDECRTLLAAGVGHGLIPRIHAEQHRHTGSVRLAIELGAASADHLDCITGPEIRALGRSDIAAVMLPGANFHMGIQNLAPARRLIEAGAVLALATDFNPGTSPTLNMQFVLSLACNTMRMMPAEAIAAATINGAYALRRSDKCGSLEPGKQADIAIMDADDYRLLSYYFAWNHCVMTVTKGSVVFNRKGENRLDV